MNLIMNNKNRKHLLVLAILTTLGLSGFAAADQTTSYTYNTLGLILYTGYG